MLGRGMSFEQIFNHLQTKYPDQLVLYARDLAQVLGKSEKALAHLIARDQLPFHVKTLGGRKCVAIHEVAQWLASTGDESFESVQEKGSRGKRARPRATADSAPEPRAPKGSIAARIMQARYEGALGLRRMGATCADTEVGLFFDELAEALLAQPGLPATTWTLTCAFWRRYGDVRIRHESKAFAAYGGDILAAKESLESGVFDAEQATMVVRGGRHIVYRAYWLAEGGWKVTLNNLGAL
tara:strand:- start:15659 stop:16378 length:720 start_codon:yes stop_codon:yes gene_type:complete